MVQEVITHFIGYVGKLIGLLNSLEIVPGVSVLFFLGGLIILGIIINQLIIRGGS